MIFFDRYEFPVQTLFRSSLLLLRFELPIHSIPANAQNRPVQQPCVRSHPTIFLPCWSYSVDSAEESEFSWTCSGLPVPWFPWKSFQYHRSQGHVPSLDPESYNLATVVPTKKRARPASGGEMWRCCGVNSLANCVKVRFRSETVGSHADLPRSI